MTARDSLRRSLLAAANPDGGRGYYAGKASRIEPTCWALLALGADGSAEALAGAGRFLAGCQRADGWLAEDVRWPVNVGFNGLAAFTWLPHSDLATDPMRRRLLAALVQTKGVQAPPSSSAQDNSLQGWPWIDATFSWVEPTCWGTLALKKARSAGLVTDSAARARVDEADRLLVNRCCRDGGWNYGNASVLWQDLRPYVPTTALALLALQDRAADPAVVRSLRYLEGHWSDQVSALGLALTAVCFSVYGRPRTTVVDRLREEVERVQSFGNLHSIALALYALSVGDHATAFQL